MLLNDFYTCHDIQPADNSYTARIAFNADHAIFGGHFPGQPVVPGVCMMELVKELLQLQTGRVLMLHTAGNVKFLQLVTPLIQPVITISWAQADGGYKVAAIVKHETTTHFKLDGLYTVMN